MEGYGMEGGSAAERIVNKRRNPPSSATNCLRKERVRLGQT